MLYAYIQRQLMYSLKEFIDWATHTPGELKRSAAREELINAQNIIFDELSKAEDTLIRTRIRVKLENESDNTIPR